MLDVIDERDRNRPSRYDHEHDDAATGRQSDGRGRLGYTLVPN